MTDQHALVRAMMETQIAPGARIVALAEREEGAQGYSGARLRYYDVTYAEAGTERAIGLVTKDAPLGERRTLGWLAARALPVPRCLIPDTTTDAPLTICMEHVGDLPARGDRARLAARALAAIHHAGLGRDRELPWVPPADPAFFAEWLVGVCWRGPWRQRLYGEPYVDWSGRAFARTVPDPRMREALDPFTAPLEAAAGRFVRDMTALWAEGDALTLLHIDLHSGQVLRQGDRARIIDWEQARYGPLYVDLPNYFSRDEALLYRDALADLGRDIPRDRFLAGYDAANPYVGFKYFGFGVADWYTGDPPRPHPRAQYWIDMILEGTSVGRRLSGG